SDVFSLGCVLAYAATGTAPFGGGSAASVLYRVVSAQPDLTGIPGPLRDVISGCLSKDPSQRPGLTALGTMISQAGPAMTATPTSFWPDPVAAVIQAAAAYTPTEVRAAPAGLGQPAMARPGSAQSGTAQSGMAQSGMAQSGMAQSGMAQDGYHAMATASMAAPRPAGSPVSGRPVRAASGAPGAPGAPGLPTDPAAAR